jgi:hypothetical protein
MVLAEEIDFKKESSEFNKTLPVMIDKETQLDRTIFSNNTFIYKNTLINNSRNEISTSEIKSKLYSTILNYVCTTPEMKNFTDNGVSVNYRYYGNKGAYLTGITISPEDCVDFGAPKTRGVVPRIRIGVSSSELLKTMPIDFLYGYI